MAALSPTLPIARLARKRDDELLERFRRGDEPAFAEIVERYRPALERYAKRVLGDRQPGPEDVVQEVFVKAHTALRADDREIQLRPWLFRLVRNRCLDELRRGGASAQVPMVPIDDALDAGSTVEHADPFVAVSRRHAVRDMLTDIAALPERQRDVLLRREVDGASHEQVAADLGITVRASKNLANRARENLARHAQARDASCHQVRDDLLHAHEQRRRASAHAYRHVASCQDCRRFRGELGTLRKAVRLLDPTPAIGGLVALAGGWTALGGAGAGVKLATATAVTVVATGGALEISQSVIGPGERSPFEVQSVILAGSLNQGERVPSGTAVVTRKFTLQAGTAKHPAVSLPCPAGTRVAGLAPDQGGKVAYGYAPSTVVGTSSTARIVFARMRLSAPASVAVGTLCKRPDGAGSLLASPAFAAARSVKKVCVRRAYLYETPGAYVVGTVFRGQPVVIRKRTRNGKWTRVTTDIGIGGWVRSSALPRGTRC